MYAGVAFSFFERVRLRQLDLTHERLGLTTGWERLRWGTVDGDVSLALSPAMSRSGSGSSAGAQGSGYTSLPTEEMIEGDDKV